MRQRFIAYPFQLNIRHLPDDDLEKCLVGLVECIKTPLTKPPSNFDDWILSKFGSGIADVFMRPYNFKVRRRMFGHTCCCICVTPGTCEV
jgi:protoporphyrinogen oxidase